jgi:hypothetical protein
LCKFVCKDEFNLDQIEINGLSDLAIGVSNVAIFWIEIKNHTLEKL